MYVSGLTKSSCIADLDPTNCVCVNGSTKLSTWVQRICVCEWIYEVKHLDPGSTKLRTWVQRICVCEWVYEVKHLDPGFTKLSTWIQNLICVI